MTGAVEEEAGYVRPYTLTGGRTRPSTIDLPIEALVEALGRPPAGAAAETRRILELTSGQYLSVAEISAHARLPIGVVRVLVGDLSDQGLVRVHGLNLAAADRAPGAATAGPVRGLTTVSVLERVLDGIHTL
jgi:hypothetical protein